MQVESFELVLRRPIEPADAFGQIKRSGFLQTQNCQLGSGGPATPGKYNCLTGITERGVASFLLGSTFWAMIPECPLRMRDRPREDRPD
jgi:hypothetical protein